MSSVVKGCQMAVAVVRIGCFRLFKRVCGKADPPPRPHFNLIAIGECRVFDVWCGNCVGMQVDNHAMLTRKCSRSTSRPETAVGSCTHPDARSSTTNGTFTQASPGRVVLAAQRTKGWPAHTCQSDVLHCTTPCCVVLCVRGVYLVGLCRYAPSLHALAKQQTDAPRRSALRAGLSGSGKTTTLATLCGEDASETTPTNGFAIKVINHLSVLRFCVRV
jgi:hypothetical protein